MFTGDFTTGTGPSYTLSLNFNGNGVTAADVLVDNVSIAAVPEPSTWAMMIFSFVASGFMAYRRKSESSFQLSLESQHRELKRPLFQGGLFSVTIRFDGSHRDEKFKCHGDD